MEDEFRQAAKLIFHLHEHGKTVGRKQNSVLDLDVSPSRFARAAIMQFNQIMRQWKRRGRADNELERPRSAMHCHAERSEASLGPSAEMLRYAQHDSTDFDC